jgi:hypothetical protein
VLLILGLFGTYFGGYRALPIFFGNGGDRPSDGAERLVEVPIQGELLESLVTGWISKVTIAPGGHSSRPFRPAAGRGYAVEYVAEGTYTVRANGAVTVLRGAEGGATAGETFDPGAEVILEAGDAILYHDPRQGGSAGNDGTTPVVLITFGSVEGDFVEDVGPPFMAGPARSSGPVAFEELSNFGPTQCTLGPPICVDARSWPKPIPAQVEFGLWEATLEPGQTLANPVPDSLVTFVTDTDGARPFRYEGEGESVTNVGDEPVHVLVLTVGPFGAGGEPLV